jgi:hypothetical protein
LRDDEFASCRRQVASVRDQLTERQAYWESNHGARRCPRCHVSAVVEDVDGIANRPQRWRCLSCGREVLPASDRRAADEESAQEPAVTARLLGGGHPRSQITSRDVIGSVGLRYEHDVAEENGLPQCVQRG